MDLAGISYDYRKYIHSYKFFETVFEYEINRLYRNKGKPVVIISTSHGGLLALNELIKISSEIKNKIKCFVPIYSFSTSINSSIANFNLEYSGFYKAVIIVALRTGTLLKYKLSEK